MLLGELTDCCVKFNGAQGDVDFRHQGLKELEIFLGVPLGDEGSRMPGDQVAKLDEVAPRSDL